MCPPCVEGNPEECKSNECDLSVLFFFTKFMNEMVRNVSKKAIKVIKNNLNEK